MCSIRAADVTIDGHKAMLVALVIGELTDNSLKYGALRQNRPVSLSWTLAEARVLLQWREPLVGQSVSAFEPRNAGSGYSLMKRMAQVQGASFEYRVAGCELLVSFELGGASE